MASTTQSDKIVIICDRGLMDGSAYLGQELWNEMLNQYDLDESRLRDQRYDLVLHLTTAADGAEQFYSLANNAARSEDVATAIDLDRKLMQAWIAHPNFVNINNRAQKGFQEKLNSVLMTVFKFLGTPTSTTFYKKYIVANPHGSLIKALEEREGITTCEFLIEDFVFYDE